MSEYTLKLKNKENDTIDRIHSNSLEEAISFFMGRKQMDKETFNKLYEVKQDEK